jgi:protein TonB
MRSVFLKAMMIAVAAFVLLPMTLTAQDARKVKKQVVPQYPQMAREMHVTGAVRLEVTVAPSGKVKEAKVLGGHPLLAQAAMDAVKDFQYEPGSEETSTIVVFNFSGQ